MNTRSFFEQLWQNYVEITPQALVIQQLLLQTEARVVNDHVALRSFADTPIRLDALQPLVLELGYSIQDDYRFEAKKLRARSYIHPDPEVPKIFLSELQRHRLPPSSQAVLEHYCQQINIGRMSQEIFWSGRHWSIPTLAHYEMLLNNSEYAAWLLVMGLRANHFTVNVNALQSTNSLEEVLRRVERCGFQINSSGGRIKGGKGELLQQGATLADRVLVEFAGGEQRLVPGCFYEFALRHRDRNGELYQGFVTTNADRIFESTSHTQPDL